GLSKRVKVIVTYFLVVLGGNFSPSANDLKDILGSIILRLMMRTQDMEWVKVNTDAVVGVGLFVVVVGGVAEDNRGY
ncbi:hypothetical protein Goshw_030511, partial [Gossypium schwendimanii]|nr:hypothetical protein [Gossypium schwendimanii]